ncbi:hypothetical protein [Halobacterium wangiae]|uniref:hypothetical protein n=1 Tax=Halobacterium wangiae TaxID=2902623 RepID=UPI001E46F593|nr:hypothetical protein [Halobacterium wangiae]
MVAGSGSRLNAGERARLAAIRSAESLAALAAETDAASVHDAYFAAKREWFDLQGRALADASSDQLPGNRVGVDGQTFCVHGITHADTRAEGRFLRQHVDRFLDAGAAVYVEQGVRSMYFSSFDDVYEMDDYAWAMERCASLDSDPPVYDALDVPFAGLSTNLDSLTTELRDAVFSLIDSGRHLYGESFEATLGDVASTFLMSHEDVSTGMDFASFSKSRAAADDPTKLGDLQDYYRRAFLPQPLEREWLRRHDPALELLTHARNERMADYAVYHSTADTVHLVVGAAHQPGVTYYLEQHRDGQRRGAEFEPVG